MEKAAVARLARGSAYLVAGTLASNVISVVAFMVITGWFLLPEQMALATVVLFFIMLGQMVADVGISTSIVKFLSQARARGESPKPIVSGAMAGQTALSLGYAILLALFADELATSLLGARAHAVLFYLASADVVFFCLSTTLASALVGLDRMKEVCAVRIVTAVARQGGAIGLLWLGLGVTGYVGGWLIGDLASFVASGALTLLALRGSSSSSLGALDALRSLWRFSWPIMITNLANLAFLWFDRLLILFQIVGAGAERWELGVYDVAMKAYTAITMVPLSIAMALFTYYGESYGREDTEAIRSSTLLTSRYLSLLFVPTALGLAALSGPTLAFFTRGRYTAGAIALTVFGISGAFTALTPMLAFLLITYERTLAFLGANVAAIAGSLALSPILLPSYGIRFGTALIRGVANALLFAFYLALTRDIAPIDGVALAKALAGSSIMALAVYAFQALWFDLMLLPAYVLLGVAVYAFCVRLLRALRPEDVVLLSEVLPEKLRKPVLFFGLLLASPNPSGRGIENP